MHIPGAFHYVKNIFGRETSGTPLQSAWKFVVHLQRWLSIVRNWPFHFQTFSFLVLLFNMLSSNHNFDRNANGSRRFDWKFWFNRTMSFYFLLSIPLVADFLFGKMESTHREYDLILGLFTISWSQARLLAYSVDKELQSINLECSQS